MNDRLTYIYFLIYFFLGMLAQGLFYERMFFIANVFLLLMAIVAVWKIRSSLQSVHIYMFLFIATYLLSIITAVDQEQAIIEAGRVIMLAPFIILTTSVQRVHLMSISRFLPWIGFFTVIIGLLLGLERNNRLESTLQYANALAIFLLINVVLTIFQYMSFKQKSSLLLLIINAAGLLLTFSRSVWVLWLISVVCLFVIFKPLQKLSISLQVFICHFVALILAIILNKEAFFFWERLSSIQTQTSEFQIRLVYWKDSLSIIRDYFWTGTGGGGWNVLLPYYQSQSYFVKYVHQHYLQILLDVGIFGLLTFLCIIITYIWKTSLILRGKNLSNQGKQDFVLFSTIPVGILLLHAAFDFDLTFPILMGLCILFISVSFVNVDRMMSKLTMWMLTIVFSLLLIVQIYLAVGYWQKEKGMNLLEQGDFHEAQAHFSVAANLMPWASSVHYESAKGYILQGNEMRDTKNYEQAKEQLLQALSLLPRETKYELLLREFEKKQ